MNKPTLQTGSGDGSAAMTRRASLRRLAGGVAGGVAGAMLSCPPPVGGAGLGSAPKLGKRDLAALGEIAREYLERDGVPGLSIAVARQGRLLCLEAFGLADRETSEPLTPSHLFRIASVSKPITSAAVFSLLEQHRLKLNDLVFGARGVLETEYGAGASDRARRVTVHHLLTHTAGGWGNSTDDPMFRNQEMSHRELIAWTLGQQPLEQEPGSKYDYSNFGYCVLGRVIEKVSGMPYAEFVQQAILARCGITAMRIAGNTLEERAQGEVRYHGPDAGSAYAVNVRRMDSHGGWLARPADLVQFAGRVIGSPGILRATAVRVMTTAPPASPNYACGWGVNSEQTVWHGGSLPGLSSILVRTASGLCWAACANSRNGPKDNALDAVMWKMVRAIPAWQA